MTMSSQKKLFQPHCDSSVKTDTIKIASLPNHVNRREVVALFNTLIGDVRSTSEFRDAVGTHIEISFLSHDAAKKALCMSGYTVGGCSLVVTPVMETEKLTSKRPDARRNLYVLGIPFDLTKSEFAAVFSRHGTVSHCVILATVDNASRRRGFVVMSNHEEAKRAMMALTRTQIKGHTIDVSWSIVQRSQGFLDGGDRAMLFDSQLGDASSPGDVLEGGQSLPSNDSDSSLTSNSAENLFTLTFTPSNILLVSNLPFIIFSDTADLEPLLFPFGKIKKLEIIALPSPQETISALVEYNAVGSAKEAKESLQGQCYANYRINAEYVVIPAAASATLMSQATGPPELENELRFQANSSSRTKLSSGPSRDQSDFKRPLQDISNSSHYSLHQASTPFHYAPPPVVSYAPISGFMPRSSSTDSWWSTDSVQSRCHFPYPYSSQMQFNAGKIQNCIPFANICD